MIKHFIAVATLLPVALGAQTPAASSRPVPAVLPIDRVVAVVGDQPLLWTDVLTAVNQRRAQGLQLPTDSAQQAALARTVLGEMIDEEILVQKAKELKLEPSESEIAASVDRQIRSIREQFKSDDEYRTELRNAGLGTPEEYKKALDNGLSASAQELVSSQFADIKAAHDRIRTLRDATKR